MNRAIRYFEAKGSTRKKLAEMLQGRTKSLHALRKWVESQGGHKLAFSEGFGFSSALGMDDDTSEPLNPHLWKRNKKNPRCWEPRQTTKDGRALHKAMSELERAVTSQAHFGQAIGLEIFCEMPYISIPGVYPIGKQMKRILLAIPSESYKPPKGVLLVRVSDVVFEKLTGERKGRE